MSGINVARLKQLVSNFSEELASILDEGVSFRLELTQIKLLFLPFRDSIQPLRSFGRRSKPPSHIPAFVGILLFSFLGSTGALKI